MGRLANARQLAAAMKLFRARQELEFGSRKELERYQRERFEQAVNHAIAHSPLYRELYAGRSPDDLPTVSKDVLMERFADWVTDPRLRLGALEEHVENLGTEDALFAGEFRVMPTGGTSGRRAIHAFDRAEWTECLVAFVRWSELFGLRPKLPRLRIATVMTTGAKHMTTRFNLSTNAGVHRTVRLDAARPAAEPARALEAFRPDVRLGYSSAIGLLAGEALDGRLRIAPGIVATTSEVRTPETTQRIREAWGTEPFEAFACTETLYGGDCEHHTGMHVFEDQALVEVVDGKLVFTSFLRRSQPLIRYELGDLAELDVTPCACGRSFARLTSVEGRADDVLRLPDAAGDTVAVHPIAIRSPLAGVPELRRYKVVHDRDGLHVRLELRSGGEEVAQHVARLLRERLAEAGAVIEPRVEIVDRLADDSVSGKFRLIESRA
jgi:phenylacetate-coenzyme A ligase PaaK-like adenylate-forming protein